MGFYRVCPTCGNSEENTRINVCCSCGTIFCDRCGNKEFDNFPLPITTMHCPRCGSTELKSNGLICNDKGNNFSNLPKGISQIIRDENSVTVITDQGHAITADQRDYWLDNENQRRFDEAIEEALSRDEYKGINRPKTHTTRIEAMSNLPKGISQIIRDENSVTVITDQGHAVTADQRDYWLDNENQRRFDEAIEEALSRDEYKGINRPKTHTTRIEAVSNSPKNPTGTMLDSAMARLQETQKRFEKYNTTGECRCCGRSWPLAILERGNGLCPLCQNIHERQR